MGAAHHDTDRPALADRTEASTSLFAGALQRAHTAELAAAGTHRRPAYRLTRELIGAAIGAGVSREAIAGILDITTSTVGNRISTHGDTLTAHQIHVLTGSTADALGLESTTGRYAISSFVAATLDRRSTA